jgi:hypothetical protein
MALVVCDTVLINVAVVGAVQMTLVQVVGVPFVRDRLVAAARPVLVLVLAVLFATHDPPPIARPAIVRT